VFLTCASFTGLVTLAAVDLGSNVQPGVGAWIATGMVGQTGLLLGAIGLVGGYVFRIQDEVKRRPLYVRHGAAVGDREPLPTLAIDRAAHR
jgi:hypothetical protein